MFARNIEVGARPQPQAIGHLRDRVDSGPVADIVEIDVAGPRNAFRQIQRAVAAILIGIAIECMVAQLEGAVASHRMVETDRARLKPGERDHQLECRTRRILAADRLVDQRRGLVI